MKSSFLKWQFCGCRYKNRKDNMSNIYYKFDIYFKKISMFIKTNFVTLQQISQYLFFHSNVRHFVEYELNLKRKFCDN